MGKKGASSWLTAVKRAFRSPSKEDQEENKRREKRRWTFRKASSTQEQQQSRQEVQQVRAPASVDERHAIALAAATAAAAEAAVATAKAAAEVVRLSRPNSNFLREHYAAVVIQTAFRGYLARRALKALRGLVKLQALVRGDNVRRQAKMTLRCMQALVRVQARVRNEQLRLSSQDGASCGSNVSSLWDSAYLQEMAERRSIQSRDGISYTDDWDERPHTIREIQAMLQSRQDAALQRERALSHAFSQQMWRRTDRNNSSSLSIGEEIEDVAVASEGEQSQPRWLDRWAASRSSCDSRTNRGRSSVDQRDRDPIKTLEIDTARPFSYTTPLNLRRQHHHVSSPLQVRSASPRFGGTPRLQQQPVPNYMAATESAKARARSQSAPRQRPMTPERDRGGSAGSAKKRLSFPVLAETYGGSGGGYCQSLKSPSFKSANGRLVAEQRSYASSSYADSFAGEMSPSSARDVNSWLR